MSQRKKKGPKWRHEEVRELVIDLCDAIDDILAHRLDSGLQKAINVAEFRRRQALDILRYKDSR